MISPPRLVVLKNKHYEEIEEDVSERVWALFGQAVHHIAERANVRDIAEKRLTWKVLGKKISGGVDIYDPTSGTISDYKVSTVSKFSFSDFKDWEQQLNCYAQLRRWNGFNVNKLEVVAFTRDHRPREAESANLLGKPYPQKAFKIELPLWSYAETIMFIEKRVELHEKAKLELPECTAAERWARPDSWAVKKVNQKNAVSGHSNYASEDSAKNAVEVLGKGHYVEHRPGKNTRCENYCPVSRFCTQFKKLSGK